MARPGPTSSSSSSRSRRGVGAGGVQEYPMARPISYPPPSAPPPLGPGPPAPTRHSMPLVSIRAGAPPPQAHGRSSTETFGRALTASARRLEKTPSDRDKVKTTATRVLGLAAKYLGSKIGSLSRGALFDADGGDDHHSGRRRDAALAVAASSLPHHRHQSQSQSRPRPAALDEYGVIRPVARSQLSHHVRQRDNGTWQATVSLVQPFVHGQYSDPQGTRPGLVTLGFFRTEEGALAACRMHAPPIWAEPVKGAVCYLCHTGAKALAKSPCHCRNCGQLVCAQCSRGRWPGGMVPPTFHNSESHVRVCDACNQLALHFRRALKEGDAALAQELHASGNVNTWSPFLLEGTKEYPVHCAAQGGSLAALRWLVDGLGCPLYDEEDKPLRTQPAGDSVLGVAARHQHADVMRWLVQAKGCSVGREIVERAQLVAAVDFLLLGGDGDGGGPCYLVESTSVVMDEEDEEVKQHDAADFGIIDADEDDEEEDEREQLRHGHGLSTRPATESKRRRHRSRRPMADDEQEQDEHESEPRCVNDCLLCGRAVNSLILPCGHICACIGCGQAARACPACRTPVVRVVRLAS